MICYICFFVSLKGEKSYKFSSLSKECEMINSVNS